MQHFNPLFKSTLASGRLSSNWLPLLNKRWAGFLCPVSRFVLRRHTAVSFLNNWSQKAKIKLNVCIPECWWGFVTIITTIQKFPKSKHTCNFSFLSRHTIIRASRAQTYTMNFLWSWSTTEVEMLIFSWTDESWFPTQMWQKHTSSG